MKNNHIKLKKKLMSHKPDHKEKDLHIKNAQFDQSTKIDTSQQGKVLESIKQDKINESKNKTCPKKDSNEEDFRHNDFNQLKNPMADNIPGDKKEGKTSHSEDVNWDDKHNLNTAGKKSEIQHQEKRQDNVDLKADRFPHVDEKTKFEKA
jgi:hypothetical protein